MPVYFRELCQIDLLSGLAPEERNKRRKYTVRCFPAGRARGGKAIFNVVAKQRDLGAWILRSGFRCGPLTLHFDSFMA